MTGKTETQYQHLGRGPARITGRCSSRVDGSEPLWLNKPSTVLIRSHRTNSLRNTKFL
jgi:hypothetical protein